MKSLRIQAGLQLKAARKGTQKDIGNLLGTKADYVAQVENGRSNITLDQLEKVGKAVGIKRIELLIKEKQ